jgi:Tol biopolymer transport system component
MTSDTLPGDVDPCLPEDGCAQRVDIYVVDRTTDQVTLVTDGQNGAPQMGFSPQISSDGRSVAYTTYSPGRQPQNVNGYESFVTDWMVGTTERVSVNSAGQLLQGWGVYPWATPALSADGRTIAFIASTCNWGLVCQAPRPDGVFHVYVRDRDAGTTTAVSAGPTPQTPPFFSDVFFQTSMSADGRYVAFSTEDRTLMPAGWDPNRCGPNVYLRDRVTGSVTVVSSHTNGGCALSGTGSGDVDSPGAVSGDGRSVAFTGRTRMTLNDTVGGKADVFVKRVR